MCSFVSSLSRELLIFIFLVQIFKLLSQLSKLGAYYEHLGQTEARIIGLVNIIFGFIKCVY